MRRAVLNPAPWLSALLVLATTLLGMSLMAHADPNRVADASVQIIISQGDTEIGTCSGSVINTAHGRGVLTAGHCTEGTGYAMIDEFGNKTALTVAYVDHVHDVAIMAIADTPAPIASYNLACSAHMIPGEWVTMTGYPLDFGRLRVEGRVASDEHEIGWWRLAAYVVMEAGAGNSGSAVRDASGHVVGILTGGFGQLGNLSIVVPASVVCNPSLVS